MSKSCQRDWFTRVVQKEEPELIWEDKHIAVVAKPPYWVCNYGKGETAQNKESATVKASSVQELVNSGRIENFVHFVILQFGGNKEYELTHNLELEFGIAHRLDCDTSGALCMAKTLRGHEHLNMLFRSHHIYKEYLCLVHGHMKQEEGTIELPIAYNEYANESFISFDKGVWAKSIYTVVGHYRLSKKIGSGPVFTLCRVVIVTGKTHQIRCHMKAIGHPLVSDRKYTRQSFAADSKWCPRLFLHAYRLGFWDVAQTWKEANAVLPQDLSTTWSKLQEIQLDDDPSSPTCRILSQPSLKRCLMVPDLNAGLPTPEPTIPTTRVKRKAAHVADAPQDANYVWTQSGCDYVQETGHWHHFGEPSVGDSISKKLQVSQDFKASFCNQGYILELQATATRTPPPLPPSPSQAPPPPPSPGPQPTAPPPPPPHPFHNGVFQHQARIEPMQFFENCVKLPNGMQLEIPEFAPPPPPRHKANKMPKPAPRPQPIPESPDEALDLLGVCAPEGAQAEPIQVPPAPQRPLTAPQSTEIPAPIASSAFTDRFQEMFLAPLTAEDIEEEILWPGLGIMEEGEEAITESEEADEKNHVDLEALEQVCCDVVRRQLSLSQKFVMRVSDLGNNGNVAMVLKSMGKGRNRRKLSQMLIARPDLFRVEGTTPESLEVTLSMQARLDVIEELDELQGHEDASQHHDVADALEEMGFDRACALRALCANNGDMMEAMDMLATMEVEIGPPSKMQKRSCGGSDRVEESVSFKRQAIKQVKNQSQIQQMQEETKRAKKRNREKMKKERRKMDKDDQRHRRDAEMQRRTDIGDNAIRLKGQMRSETHQLSKVLAQSQSEAARLAREEEMEDFALEAALKASMGQSLSCKDTDWLSSDEESDSQNGSGDDALRAALAKSKKDTGNRAAAHKEEEGDDEEFLKALQLSEKQEKERQYREEEISPEEQEEIDRALKESMQIYELFHAGGADVFEKSMRQSMDDSRDDYWNDDNDPELEDILSAYAQIGNDSPGVASSSIGVAASSSSLAPGGVERSTSSGSNMSQFMKTSQGASPSSSTQQSGSPFNFQRAIGASSSSSTVAERRSNVHDSGRRSNVYDSLSPSGGGQPAAASSASCSAGSGSLQAQAPVSCSELPTGRGRSNSSASAASDFQSISSGASAHDFVDATPGAGAAHGQSCDDTQEQGKLKTGEKAAPSKHEMSLKKGAQETKQEKAHSSERGKDTPEKKGIVHGKQAGKKGPAKGKATTSAKKNAKAAKQENQPSSDEDDEALRAALEISKRETSGNMASHDQSDEDKELMKAIALSEQQDRRERESSNRFPGPGAGSTSVAEHPIADASAAGFNMRHWFVQRRRALRIDFEEELLWFALHEMEEEQMSDEDVVKMWLGFAPDETMPSAIATLVCEMREKKIILRLCKE